MVAFLARFGVALSVALFVFWSSWARGGSNYHYFWALPWICLLTLEMMFVLPPRMHGQTPRGAVRHLLRRIVRDPTFYFGVALLIFLAIQWLNGPRELEWVAADSEWRYTDPPIPDLPSCVDQDGAKQVFLWFMAVVTAVMAVRACLDKTAKYFILRAFCINGALLAILGMAQMATSPDKLFWYRPMAVQFFATFGYPNHAGAFFVLVSAINMGLVIRALANLDERNNPILYSITLILNIMAAYLSLSRAAMVLETGLIVFGLVYGCIYLYPRIGMTGLSKIFASIVVIFLCLGYMTIKGSGFAKELKTITAENVSGVYDGDREMLAEAAVKIWQDNPWPGVGGWGFKNYVGLYVPQKDWDKLEQAGKANVHNDLLQFLCEHGAIGGGLIFAIVITILIHLGWNLAHMKRLFDQNTDRNSTWFGSIPPTVIMALAGLTCTVVHCTMDLPFRSTAILLTWFIVLACLPGMLRLKD